MDEGAEGQRDGLAFSFNFIERMLIYRNSPGSSYQGAKSCKERDMEAERRRTLENWRSLEEGSREVVRRILGS